MHPLESLVQNRFAGTMTYKEYRLLIADLHLQGKVTGPVQNEDLLAYSKLNVHRMERWDKHADIADKTKNAVHVIDKKIDILVITEGWCGDAAQIIPVVEKIIAENKNLRTHYILRDEHPEIMDMFLTNGKSRSIPIFVFMDEEGKVIGKYGPRPAMAQHLIDRWKSEGVDSQQLKEKLHLWYARDKHTEIEREFREELDKATREN